MLAADDQETLIRDDDDQTLLQQDREPVIDQTVQLTPYRRVVCNIFSVGLPFMIQTTADIGNQFLNLFLISRLGEQSLAAMGLATAVFSAVGAIDGALLVPLNNLIGIEYARGNTEAISVLVQRGWLLSIILTVPATIVYLAIRPILTSFNQPPAVVDLVNTYLFPYAFSVLSARWNDVNMALLSATGRQKALSILRTLTDSIGVGASFFLVYGIPGHFAGLGMLGAGLSMLIQRWSNLACTLIYIKCFANMGGYRLFTFQGRQSAGVFKKMLNVSAPVLLLSMLKTPITFLETIFIGLLGTQSLAFNTIAEIFSSVAAPPLVAVVRGSSIVVSQKYGARQYMDMRRHVNVAFVTSTVISLLPLITFSIFSNPLMRVFMQGDASPAMIELMRDIFIVDGIKHFVDNLGAIANGSLMGVLDTFIPAIANLLDGYALYLPLSYVFGKLFSETQRGVLGVHLGVTVSIFANVLFLLIRWKIKSNDQAFLEGQRGTRVVSCLNKIFEGAKNLASRVFCCSKPQPRYRSDFFSDGAASQSERGPADEEQIGSLLSPEGRVALLS